MSALLGTVTFIGGTSLLTACEQRSGAADGTSGASFNADDVAFLDEIAETILPETSTPGAKAAKTGAFMALMVTDVYSPADQKIFRDGMRRIEEESRKANNAGFMQATPAQRLALLERLDREQKRHMDARENASRKAKGLKEIPPEARAPDEHLSDQRQEAALGSDAGAATAITSDSPAHYFRMMKELALLGYFTSEIGCKQAQRYIESPGRFDPCVPYTAGEKAWAPHA